MLSSKFRARRTALAAAAIGCALASGLPLAAQAAPEAAWPTKPVRIVVPFAAGGPNDLIARSLSTFLRDAWGQPVLVENRSGANGTIGATHVARAKPDGHTLLLTAVSHVMNPSMFPQLGYDAVKSFSPIMRMGSYPMALVVQSNLPYKNLADLTVALKKDPGAISVASTGPGSAPHLAAALFEQGVGGKFTHVPYQGAAPMYLALMSGEVKASFHGSVVWDQVKAGKVRALAITGDKRLAEYPDVPTIAESGFPGYNVMVWYGLMGPADMDPALVKRIYTDVQRAMREESITVPMKTAGIWTEDIGPVPFKQSMEREAVQWRKVIQEAGLKAD
jgi:tripartite-type tricarboxylate transporter receptor subunit TctC